MTVHRLNIGKRLSEAAIFNQTIYLAGQVADDHSQDITGQTKQVLAAIDKLLAEAGSDKSHLLQVTIFIADMNDFAAINEVYGHYVGDSKPARETVEVSRLPRDVNVEISCIAVK